MPIYEYSCQKCGYQLELMQKVSDAPARDCPECHQPALVKLISAAGFQLKGTGWYVTDFRDNKKKESSAPAGKNDTKAETAAPKTETVTSTAAGAE